MGQINQEYELAEICYWLNMIALRDPSKQRNQELDFRADILMIHLIFDYLFNKIIELQFTNRFIGRSKDSWNTSHMAFMNKLKIVYASAGGLLDPGFFKNVALLNQLRNNLAHNFKLKVNESMNIDKLNIYLFGGKSNIEKQLKKKLSPQEHVLFSCIGYINVLFQYLVKDIAREKVEYSINVTFITDVPGLFQFGYNRFKS